MDQDDPELAGKNKANCIVLDQNSNYISRQNSVKINQPGKLKGICLQWDKYMYTMIILVVYLNYGIINTLFPMAMVDMKFMFKTSMVKLNYEATFGSLGYLCGSLCGFLYKYVNRQLTFVVMVSILGVFIAVQPLSQCLWQLYASSFMWEMGGAAFDSGNAVWIVELWRDNAPPVLQLTQMMYGAGTIVGPLIVEPFIVGDLSNSTEDMLSTNDLNVTDLMTTTAPLNNSSYVDINYSVDRLPKLKIPFLFGGGSTLIMPILLLVMFFIKRYKEVEEADPIDNQRRGSLSMGKVGVIMTTEKESELSPCARRILIALVALNMMAHSGMELTFMTYGSTYVQYLPLRVSASTGAKMMSVFSTTYTLGRLLSAFISTKLRADVMLSYHMVVVTISYCVLFWGQNSELLLYIGMGSIGFGFSAMWPSFFSFAETHIGLTDKVTSIFAFTASFFFLLAPFIIAPVIEKEPNIFLDVEFSFFFAVVLLFILNLVIVRISSKAPVTYTVKL